MIEDLNKGLRLCSEFSKTRHHPEQVGAAFGLLDFVGLKLTTDLKLRPDHRYLALLNLEEKSAAFLTMSRLCVELILKPPMSFSRSKARALGSSSSSVFDF